MLDVDFVNVQGQAVASGRAAEQMSLGDGEGDTGMECVVCMCEPRDTLIIPCRHLCLCFSCAESLRSLFDLPRQIFPRARPFLYTSYSRLIASLRCKFFLFLHFSYFSNFLSLCKAVSLLHPYPSRESFLFDISIMPPLCRVQSSNCPICRSPFRALLQIQALRKKLIPPTTQHATNTQISVCFSSHN